ncbi:MAG TPA: c-type cytochrome [Acidimicrobiia bacterium]|jgi:ubiquinol-cytochrome c reductase cytochrome c subunit
MSRVRLQVGLVMTSALALLAFLVVVCDPEAVSSSAADAPPPAPPVAHLFARDCATCHGADARGTDLAPDLHGVGRALIDYELSTGRMPLPTTNPTQTPERGTPKYSPATIRELVEYVAALAGGHGPPIPQVDPARGDLSEGGDLFRLNCAACHSWAGTGGALVDRAAPSTHEADAQQIAEAIRTGPGNMPAFGSAVFDEHQLNSIVRYVRYLDHPDDHGGTPLWHLGPLAEGAVAVFVALGALLLAVRWIGTRT